jgi:hypothetical protein
LINAAACNGVARTAVRHCRNTAGDTGAFIGVVERGAESASGDSFNPGKSEEAAPAEASV